MDLDGAIEATVRRAMCGRVADFGRMGTSRAAAATSRRAPIVASSSS